MATKSRSRKSSSSRKNSSRSASARKKSSSRKKGSSRKKSSGRKYGKKASQEVRTEMHHMRSGKHKVKNRKQAIAIGLSKARQKGAKVPSKKAA
ncbi:MAG TPA: DUF6496 domain-containing protein [Terriglobales bacterium]|nr:DUF6496 domain-containing protein [Terriglobales bacterium]